MGPRRLNENPAEGAIRDIQMRCYKLQTRKNVPNQLWAHDLYAKFLFSARLKMDHMLRVCNLTSFDLPLQNRSKMKRGIKGNDVRKDLKLKAIQMANDHIQTADISIVFSTKDNLF